MSKTDATIGYLTIVHEDRSGWTGGLLVLNRGGRPMEFQCTLPVRPSRAHRILFGSTLRAHLIQEVISPALLDRCRNRIDLLVTDLPELLTLDRDGDSKKHSNLTIGLSTEAAVRNEGPIEANSIEGYTRAVIAGSEFFLPRDQIATLEPVMTALEDLPDAEEPFDRIRAAISEAHQQMARAADTAREADGERRLDPSRRAA